MASKKIKAAALIAGLAVISFCGCGDKIDARKDEHLIGEKLTNVSPLNNSAGGAKNQVAVYDASVKRIQQFDLDANTHVRSLAVDNPGAEHSVLYDTQGNYVIDFSSKHLTIYDKSDQPYRGPLQFVGTPVSAAFRPNLGLLVMYDDKMSVGVLKLSPEGYVIQARVFPGAFGSVTISAGDVDENGRLVVALSNGKMAVADLAASLSSGTWNYSTVNTALDNPVWVSPVNGAPDLALVQEESQVSLVNLNTQTTTAGPQVDRKSVMFYGKRPDGHIIYSDKHDSSLMHTAFVKNGVIETLQANFAPWAILNSQLDLGADRWTMVSAASSTRNWRTGEITYIDRSVQRFTLNNGLLAVLNEKVPDAAKFELSGTKLFALFPSKLGSAVVFNLLNWSRQAPLTHFNVKYFP